VLEISTSLPRHPSYDWPKPLPSRSSIPPSPVLASSGHIMTVPYHKTSCDKTGSLAMTSNPVKRISPPSGKAYGEGADAPGKAPTHGEARIELNKGLKDRDRKTKTYQSDSVVCDWQTVFWRLPTPQPSNNHTVPSSAEPTIPVKMSAVGPQSSVSGLKSHLAEDEVVTLGEKLAGERSGERMRICDYRSCVWYVSYFIYC
jgi:hypothetical protein